MFVVFLCIVYDYVLVFVFVDDFGGLCVGVYVILLVMEGELDRLVVVNRW